MDTFADHSQRFVELYSYQKQHIDCRASGIGLEALHTIASQPATRMRERRICPISDAERLRKTFNLSVIPAVTDFNLNSLQLPAR
jgi:hypothetical protein